MSLIYKEKKGENDEHVILNSASCCVSSATLLLLGPSSDIFLVDEVLALAIALSSFSAVNCLFITEADDRFRFQFINTTNSHITLIFYARE